MATISCTDLLYVTAVSGGITVMAVKMSGISSLGEVYRKLRLSAPGTKGVVNLSLRNSTQGWSQKHVVVLQNDEKIPALKTKHIHDGLPSLFAEL